MPVRVMWCRWHCRACGGDGEIAADSLTDLQVALGARTLKCGRCGSRNLNIVIPGPFPQSVVDKMKRAADDGCIVTGMEGNDVPCGSRN